MRVTQRSIHRNYLTSLNRNASQLADSTQKMNSGRKFSKISENVSDGARAFKLRRNITKNEQYLSNIEDMRNELKSSENGMLDVVNIMKSIEEKMIQGMNTASLSETELKLIGSEIDNLKSQILQISNAQNTDKYTYAGSDNKAPFAFDAINNIWTFHGVDVNEERSEFKDTPRFLDIGFGLQYDVNGKIDKNSVAQLSTAGVDVFGHGTTIVDGEKIPNNIIAFIDKVAKDFMAGNVGQFDKNLGQMKNVTNNILIQVGDVGNRAKFLEDNEARIESELIDLKGTQSKIEAVSIEEESIYNNSYKMAWQISLQLASSLLQTSIFDFMR